MPIIGNVEVPFTPDEFREIFPIFADAEIFPDQSIVLYSELAVLNLSKGVFGKYWVYCCALFVAHNLALEHNMISSGNFGFAPGGSASSLSASVGSVSTSEGYDNSFYRNAGDFAQTQWGRMLWRYIRMFGVGGAVVWNTMQRSLTG